MSYSSNGGTLTLPSPTHFSTSEAGSALRSAERTIRRSLSRSPSKFQLRKSPSGGCGSPRSPLSPSPLTPGGSPSKLFGSPFPGITTHQKSPLATPFSPSVKLSLRSAKHKTPGTHPKRTSPRSPLKRVLSESLDRANTQPQPSRATNFFGESLSPDMTNSPRRKSFEKQPAQSMFSVEIPPPPVNQALARLETDSNAYSPSPLKRTDSTMNLAASFGSPVPKRRSMHGSTNFGSDFDVFDHATASTPNFNIHEDTTENPEPAPSPIFSNHAMMFQNLNMPKRSTSLRKSTLQQRQEKSSSWSRRQAERAKAAAALANENGFTTPQKVKDRPRLSLDHFLPPQVEHSSPFTSGPLPNPSMHMFTQQPPAFKAHPLSRTLTQSSSSGSIADDSPTHAAVQLPARIPVRLDDESRPKIDFSKSLPAGSLRPTAFGNLKRQEFGNDEFSTPKNDFNSAKPHAAAFMSTGLISKANHNPEETQSFARHHLRKSVMPDTPCKKPAGGFHTMPAPDTNAMNKVKEFSRHSFGTPSVPFGSAMKPSIVNRNVFGSDFSNKGRRGSFLSIPPDDHTSPENLDNLMSDNEMPPPTPTKSIFNDLPGDGSPTSARGTPYNNMFSVNKPSRPSSKLSILTVNCESSDDGEDFGDMISPTAVSFRFAISSSKSNMSSFGRSRARKGSNAPAPLSLGSPKPFVSPPPPGSAKIPTLTAHSPNDRIDFAELNSPHTPHVGVGDLSEDASRLTVSGHGRRPLTRQNTMADFAAKAPPATPTTGRENVLPNGGVTPIHAPKVSDLDENLVARFDKVEAIGGGEFSDVYRVTKTADSFNYFGDQPYNNNSSFNTQAQTPSTTPLTPRVHVFAVKKARKPFNGSTDRHKRLQEVQILQQLGKSDHVIQLHDSWEIDGYLYIQTEFCEEGSLDVFLENAGRKGKLDDFRVWKIMVELGEGIRHIHRSGFIHLDLKPANVFITFEGVLKIGDFGMATTNPAPPNIDGEGDREYIGPEILEGKFEPPADIFAFGLIMLEIAANVSLPDNGPSWMRLRSGDFSDVPSLTWSNASSVLRDASGNPIVDDSDTSMDSFMSDDEMEVELPAGSGRKRNYNPTKTRSTSHDPANLFGSIRRGELASAPPFMVDKYHVSSMDTLVRSMIQMEPVHRPSIEDLMKMEGVRWVRERRRAGATVFEGCWGPADDVLGSNGNGNGNGGNGSGNASMVDAEMTDV